MSRPGIPAMLTLDHLAVVAGDLDTGIAAVKAAIGASFQGGGKHPDMGTHNVVGATGGDTYLEVIAVDPEAPPPGRARWFGLDDLASDAAPHLGFWVASVPDLDQAIAAARAAGVDPGPAVSLSRGALSWRLSVPDTGRAPLDGAAPILIEWPGGQNPASAMADCGVVLRDLTIRSPAAPLLTTLLDALGGTPANVRIAQGDASTVLTACYSGPRGEVRLSGRAA